VEQPVTPIEWNESEPGFPDFLPPKPEPQRLTEEEVVWRIKGVLKAAGIEAFITDARISAVFPDGAEAFYQQLELDTRK
jgi:hypothetical protein